MPAKGSGEAPRRLTEAEKQQIFDAVHIHNKSFQEVARMLGVSRDTVSRNYKRLAKDQDSSIPVDTEDLTKLGRDVYKKIYQLIDGFSDASLEKSNAYQLAGAIQQLTQVLKDVRKLTGENLDEALPEDIDIRDRMDRLDGAINKLGKLSGRINQEKVRLEKETLEKQGGPQAEA